MYHHRYQPQASHLANRNTSAFVTNNHHASSASASKANNYVSAEAAGQRNIVISGNSSSAQHNNNSFNFGNHNKPGTNSVYHSGAYSSQPRQYAEERHDVIFRRVRGILNKITPETFDKLSKELVNVGLDSPRTLRGLIYLLFDKALKDLKYSSLYAKLCQQLSEKAPNFEQEPGPNTFCKFLISKCEDEFERRRKATEDFDGKNELTDEEFEQKVIAKQKMLGNIKFICELGKKRLLQEEILHECIRGLLSKKKERPIQDQAQDLECLCQIMRTIGSLLDIQASRNLMNQYFERIDMYSKKPELPSRIRFMLRDVIDLRNNKWRPRPFQREDNVPQPLSRLREEAGFNGSSTTTSIDNIGNTKNLMNMSDLSKMHGSKVSSLLIDDDGPSFTTTTDFHWGSNTFLPNETEFDIFSSTMPACNKIGTSTNAPGTIRTNSTSLSNNTNSTATLSKHQSNQMTSVSQAKHEAHVNNNNNNNGTSDIHNRIDPFSDTFKTNKFGQNNRMTIPRDNIFGMHGNQDMDRHSENTHGFIRGNLSREPLLPPSQSGPAFVKPKDLDLGLTHPDREALPMGSLRGNPVAYNNVPLNNRGPLMRDDNAAHISRRPIDSPRPPSHRRGDDTSPGSRFANPQRHFDDMPPPSLPPPAKQNLPQHHPRQQQNHLRNSRQGFDAEHRPEQRFAHGVANGNSGIRDRRFDRGDDRFENEPRQPKFSGANYRLPGRDNRNQPGQQSREQQNFNRANQQPESELNMNWRSVGASAPAEPSKDPNFDSRAQKSVHEPRVAIAKPGNQLCSIALDKPILDVGFANDVKAVSRQTRDVDLSVGDANRVEIDRFHKKVQQPLVRDISNTNSLPLSPSGEVDQQVSHKHSTTSNQLSKFDEIRSSEQGLFEDRNEFRPPQSRQNGPRRFNNQDSRSNQQDIRSNHPDSAGFHNHRNDGPPSRSNQNEFADRMDRERNIQRRPLADEEDRRLPLSRPREDLERRNFRPAFGRNQSFDAQNTIDANQIHDWRKDVPAVPVKKDHIPSTSSLVNSPLLTKPPMRLSETDFSLRPSHNLGGRAYSETVTQATTKSNELTNELDNNHINTDARSITRPQLDGTSTANKLVDNKDCDKSNAVNEDKKDVYVAKFNSLLNQRSSDMTRIASKMKELKIPKSHHSECLISAMKQSIIGSEADRENTSKLLVSLVPSIFDPCSLLSAFRVIFEQLHALEAETPKVKSLVAEFLSRAVFDGLLALEEVSGVLLGGKHHPLFLLLLQKLEKKGGQAWLIEKFVASKINLIDMLPEADRSKNRLATALKDRCLGFLDPMLTIEPDLWAQMMRDPSPGSIYRWIKENVDQTIQSTPTFAHVLIACMLKYIQNITMERFKSSGNSNQQKDSESDDSTKSSPTNSSSQAVIDLEKELLSKYQQILQAFLKDKQMQLATLYALQSFYHGLDFPRGALLRWFHMLYDLSIVDDDVFFIWKEEINDEFPGKGQALFQVNTWLNWLAEPDSEDEDEV